MLIVFSHRLTVGPDLCASVDAPELQFFYFSINLKRASLQPFT